MMKTILIALIVMTIAAATGCGKLERASAQRAASASMSRCQKELSSIRGMEPLLKTRDRSAAEDEGRPFEGLDLALTINGTIQSEAAEEDEDDSCASQNTRRNFERIIEALRANQMPPTVNFVAGRYLDESLESQWLENHNLLGSLTFTRKSARKKAASEFIDDLKRNEEALAPLLKKHSQPRLYFRFQRLKESKDEQGRAEVRSFLARAGYTIAPGTIDSRDWRFAQIHCSATARGDEPCAVFVKQAFYSLLFDTTQKAREATKQLIGRESKQILMVEASQFTADTLAETLQWYKRLGARFVSLDDALKDPLYQTGPAGDVQAVSVFQEVKRLQSGGEEE
jgi:hypothetical protein